MVPCAEQASDVLQWHTGLVELGGLFVTRLPTDISGAAADLRRSWLARLSTRCRMGDVGKLTDDLLGHPLDDTMVPVDHRLDRLAEVAQQVLPISMVLST
jgi:hypothetical protein